jgi:cytidylate kinase
MYRSVAFAALRVGVDVDATDSVAEIARSMDLRMDPDGTVVVDGADATVEIRASEVSRAVSLVAANPGVRDEMRRRQREWAEHRGGGVLEGRDIGTVVFPDAELKVYLDADPEIRATRRAAELEGVTTASVAADLARRDQMDSSRQHAPLREADGAVRVDTTNLGIDEIVDLLMEQLP